MVAPGKIKADSVVKTPIRIGTGNYTGKSLLDIGIRASTLDLERGPQEPCTGELGIIRLKSRVESVEFLVTPFACQEMEGVHQSRACVVANISVSAHVVTPGIRDANEISRQDLLAKQCIISIGGAAARAIELGAKGAEHRLTANAQTSQYLRPQVARRTAPKW